MGERKGVNKYYPPDYDPRTGSLDAYHGSHPLRERAKKIHEGILVIRFEMPYNIWCGGCGIHIGMGVRYNAEKQKIGNYYTTPIYKFRMKCHLCDQYFEIRTDPQKCDYEILSGCRRKEERWDTEAAGNVQTTHREEKEKMMTSAMYKLEHQAVDEGKVKKVAPTLGRLQDIRDVFVDDFHVNQVLRKNFREEKKVMQKLKDDDNDFKKRMSLPGEFKLTSELDEDKATAKKMRFGGDTSNESLLERQQKEVKKSSIFPNQSNPKLNPNHSNPKLNLVKSLKGKKSLPCSAVKTLSSPMDIGVKRKGKLAKGKLQNIGSSCSISNSVEPKGCSTVSVNPQPKLQSDSNVCTDTDSEFISKGDLGNGADSCFDMDSRTISSEFAEGDTEMKQNNDPQEGSLDTSNDDLEHRTVVNTSSNSTETEVLMTCESDGVKQDGNVKEASSSSSGVVNRCLVDYCSSSNSDDDDDDDVS